MKNIIISLFYLTIICLSLNCKAQPPQDGENRLNNYINKFVGTWLWSSGNNSLQLIIKKENIKNQYLSFDYREDMLIGFHKYINNGNIIENSTQYSNTNYLDKKSTIYGSTKTGNPDEFTGLIRHLSKDKSVWFIIEYIDATHIKLVKLKNTAGIKFRKPTDPPFDGTITLPQNIILTKQ